MNTRKYWIDNVRIICMLNAGRMYFDELDIRLKKIADERGI